MNRTRKILMFNLIINYWLVVVMFFYILPKIFPLLFFIFPFIFLLLKIGKIDSQSDVG